jgi:hypothetical protein
VEGAKEKMRELIGDEKAIPPQLFNGNTYCGVSLCWSKRFSLLACLPRLQ